MTTAAVVEGYKTQKELKPHAYSYGYIEVHWEKAIQGKPALSLLARYSGGEWADVPFTPDWSKVLSLSALKDGRVAIVYQDSSTGYGYDLSDGWRVRFGISTDQGKTFTRTEITQPEIESTPPIAHIHHIIIAGSAFQGLSDCHTACTSFDDGLTWGSVPSLQDQRIPMSVVVPFRNNTCLGIVNIMY